MRPCQLKSMATHEGIYHLKGKELHHRRSESRMQTQRIQKQFNSIHKEAQHLRYC